jgi:hypothetical protein
MAGGVISKFQEIACGRQTAAPPAMAGVDMMRAYARRTLKKVPFSPYEHVAI